MKKIISILLTLALSIGVCSNVVLAADVQASIGTQKTAYSISDIYGNVSYKAPDAGKVSQLIYVDDNNDNVVEEGSGEKTYKYNQKSFLGTGDFLRDSNNEYGGGDRFTAIAISYPPALKTENRVTEASQQATISADYKTLTSTASNITYKLPEKKNVAPYSNESGWTISNKNDPNEAAEVAMLDRGLYTTTGTIAGTFDWNISDAKYDKIHLLVATGSSIGRGKGIFKVTPKYADETIGDTIEYRYVEPTDMNDGNPNHFIAELEARETERYAIKSADNNTIPAFRKSTDKSIFVYEYCIDVNENKTLSAINFEHSYADDSNTSTEKYEKNGFAIIGVAGEIEGGTTPFYKDLLGDETLTNNTSRLYIDKTDSAELTGTYARKDFLGFGYNADQAVALQWPLDYGTHASFKAADQATIEVDNNGTGTTDDDIVTVTSKRSGMSYELSRGGEKDAVVLYTSYKSPDIAEIPVHNAPYNKVSLLLATAHNIAGDTSSAANNGDDIKVYVNYTDGTTSLPAEPVFADNANPTTGTQGYIYGKVPTILSFGAYNISDQKYSNIYLTDVATQITTISNAPYRNDEYTADFKDPYKYSADTAGLAFLFEYTLTVDPTKTVKSITVDTVVAEAIRHGGKHGVAVLGVTGEQAVVTNPAVVANDNVAIKAYTKTAGDVYAAIYEKGTNKLVAMGLAKNVASETPANVTVNDDAIEANGQYDIKLFVWATDGSFAPLAGATNVNIAQ